VFISVCLSVGSQGKVLMIWLVTVNCIKLSVNYLSQTATHLHISYYICIGTALLYCFHVVSYIVNKMRHNQYLFSF